MFLLKMRFGTQNILVTFKLFKNLDRGEKRNEDVVVNLLQQIKKNNKIIGIVSLMQLII